MLPKMTAELIILKLRNLVMNSRGKYFIDAISGKISTHARLWQIKLIFMCNICA